MQPICTYRTKVENSTDAGEVLPVCTSSTKSEHQNDADPTTNGAQASPKLWVEPDGNRPRTPQRGCRNRAKHR